MRKLLIVGLAIAGLYSTHSIAGAYERSQERSSSYSNDDNWDYGGERRVIIEPERNTTLLRQRVKDNIQREYHQQRQEEYRTQNPYKPNPAYERYLQQQGHYRY